jgi:hypothetical protein
MKNLSATEGWEIAFCPQCGYAVEKCRWTQFFTTCPLCLKQDKEVKLVDRFVVHFPENKVMRPLDEQRRA